MGKVTLVAHGLLGDQICLISAAHTYARITGDEAYVQALPDLVDLYTDGLLKAGDGGENRFINVYSRHRVKDESPDINYLGTFLSLIVPDLPLPAAFELPALPAAPRRCVIQPYARSIVNPDTEYLQSIVDAFTEATGKTLFVIGSKETPRVLDRVDYSLLETSAVKFMQHIAAAEIVFTPRSAAAHIAAAYKVPAFVWLPSDGENWHLDYAEWQSTKVSFAAGVDAALSALVSNFQ